MDELRWILLFIGLGVIGLMLAVHAWRTWPRDDASDERDDDTHAGRGSGRQTAPARGARDPAPWACDERDDGAVDALDAATRSDDGGRDADDRERSTPGTARSRRLTWSQPTDSVAQSAVGDRRPGPAAVVSGAALADTALGPRPDATADPGRRGEDAAQWGAQAAPAGRGRATGERALPPGSLEDPLFERGATRPLDLAPDGSPTRRPPAPASGAQQAASDPRGERESGAVPVVGLRVEDEDVRTRSSTPAPAGRRWARVALDALRASCAAVAARFGGRRRATKTAERKRPNGASRWSAFEQRLRGASRRLRRGVGRSDGPSGARGASAPDGAATRRPASDAVSSQPGGRPIGHSAAVWSERGGTTADPDDAHGGAPRFDEFGVSAPRVVARFDDSPASRPGGASDRWAGAVTSVRGVGRGPAGGGRPERDAGTGRTSQDTDGGRRGPALPEKILVLYVVAPRNRPFTGVAVSASLRRAGLQLGRFSIYHRLDEAGEPLVSVANMVQPGTLSEQDLIDFTTPGLAVFVQVHAVSDPFAAFHALLETVDALARDLNGVVLDEHRSTATNQTLGAMQEDMQRWLLSHRADWLRERQASRPV